MKCSVSWGAAGQKCDRFLPVLAATLILGVLRAGPADSGHLMPVSSSTNELVATVSSTFAMKHSLQDLVDE